MSFAQESQNSAVNESTYVNMSNQAWKSYAEDLRYSTKILNDFAHKNITSDQALASTMGLYLLTYQSSSQMSRVVPPEKFANFHNNTVRSMYNLQYFLWNMGKFYETNRTEYIIVAQDYFNVTTSYREKALEDQVLNLTK